LVTRWVLTFVNLRGFSTAKWIQNLGTLGIWIPTGLLVAAGVLLLAAGRPATEFSAAGLVPRGDVLGVLGFWSAMCFAFAGLEVSGLVGQEVHRPERTLPLGALVAGLATTAIYILGSVALLVVLNPSELAERTGIADAVALASERVGLSGVGSLTAALVGISLIGTASSWIAGGARVLYSLGADGSVPAVFAHLHPRFFTPHLALLALSAANTLAFLASVFFSFGGGGSTIQEAYDILVSLTLLASFVPYLYLFLAVLGTPAPRPASSFLEWPRLRQVLAWSGALRTLVAMALLFVPPEGTKNWINFEVNLILPSVAVAVLGLVVYRKRAPERA